MELDISQECQLLGDEAKIVGQDFFFGKKKSWNQAQSGLLYAAKYKEIEIVVNKKKKAYFYSSECINKSEKEGSAVRLERT